MSGNQISSSPATLVDAYHRYVRRMPSEAVAIESDGFPWSVSRLALTVSAYATGLAAVGVDPGDRVVIAAPDGGEAVAASLAVMVRGGIVAGLNMKQPEERRRGILAAIRPRCVIAAVGMGWDGENVVTFDQLAQAGERPTPDAAVVHPSSPCLLVMTSGVTGRGKGVVHSQRNLTLTGSRCADAWTLKEGMRLHSTIPLFTAVTFGSLVAPWLLRCGVLIIGKGYASWSRLSAARPDFVMGNPTTFHDLAKQAGRGDRLDASGTVAGAPCSAESLHTFRSRTGIRITPHYGMSEMLAMTGGDDGNDGSVGRSLPGVALRIDGDGPSGEVLCKSDTAFLDYLDGEPAHRRDPWFATGDIGAFDADGRLTILGRRKECIIRGGNNIFPHEIEDIALATPGVEDAAACGLPEERLGESVALLVAASRFEETVCRLRDALGRSLPPYMVPDAIIAVDAVPRTATGKVNRVALQHLAERLLL